MKNLFKNLGIIAIAAVIGLSMAALSLTGCSNPSSSDPSPRPGEDKYSGNTPTGDRYELVITEDPSARYTGQTGDSYVLTVKSGETVINTSTGTVVKTGTGFTLKPTGQPTATITVTVSDGGLEKLEADPSVKWDDSEETIGTITLAPINPKVTYHLEYGRFANSTGLGYDNAKAAAGTEGTDYFTVGTTAGSRSMYATGDKATQIRAKVIEDLALEHGEIDGKWSDLLAYTKDGVGLPSALKTKMQGLEGSVPVIGCFEYTYSGTRYLLAFYITKK